MRQHHTKVHGDPLPNRECKGCGTEFYVGKAQRKFCDACNPNAGEHNGNWKEAKESTTCESCETEFEYYPSNEEGHFCSDCVEADGTFEGTRFWRRGERVEQECDPCGTAREVLKSDVKRGDRRFCDRNCLSEWMSENRRGEDHYHWIDEETKYTGRWRSVRRAALERDDYECQRCGKKMDEMDRELDVHHLVPVRSFDDPQEAHRLLNLVSHCRRCHRIVEENAETASV